MAPTIRGCDGSCFEAHDPDDSVTDKDGTTHVFFYCHHSEEWFRTSFVPPKSWQDELSIAV